MRKPFWSWSNTLRRLGYTRRKGSTPWKRTKARSMQMEQLEARQLLATDLGGVQFCDDLDAALVATEGSWETTSDPAALDGALQYHEAGTGLNTATWQFDNLQAGGRYAALATWVAQDEAATDALYTIRDGSQTEGTAFVNQQTPSMGTDPGEQSWQQLGIFTVDSGTLEVELSDNADGRVLADAVVLLPLPAERTGGTADDGDVTFAQSGEGWTRLADEDGYQKAVQLHQPGTGSNTATWTIDGLQPGLKYQVLATWTPVETPEGGGSAPQNPPTTPDRASNAPYTILDGSNLLDTVRVNQQISADDRAGFDRSWESLGVYTIDSGTLNVTLSDDADGPVQADAIWAIVVADVTEAPAVIGE